MAKGIAVKVFSELDVAAVAAAVLQMKGIWGKAGQEISSSLAKDASALKALQKEMVDSANAAARAEIAANKAAVDQMLADRRRGFALQKEEAKRTQADIRAIEMAPIYGAKKAQADREAEQASGRAAAAADDHTAAIERNTAAAAAGAQVFNKLGMVATGASALMGGAALKAATDFEAGVTRIQSSTDMSAANISKLQTGLLQLSTQMGVSMNDLLQGAYQTARAGGIFKDAGNDINFMRDAIKLAQIDGVELKDVISGTTTTINDFNISADRMHDVLTRMKVAAGELKEGNIGDLGRALHNIEGRYAASTITPGMSQDQRLDQASQLMAIISRVSTGSGASLEQTTDWLNNALAHITNPTGPQAQFLGGLLAKNNMAPSDLVAGLKDPNKGYMWVMKTIQDAINANMGPDGKVTVPVHQMDEDILAKLSTARNALRSPQEKAIADELIADANAGVIPDKNLFKAKRLASLDPEFGKGFMTAYNNAFQYSQAFGNRALPQTLDPTQAFNTATGTMSGMVSGFQLFGTPQNAEETKRLLREQKNAPKNDLDASWQLVQNTAKWQIADAKAQLHALGVVIGQELMPTFKEFLSILRDVFSFFSGHKAVLDAFIHSMEAFAAVWAGQKLIGGITTIISAFDRLYPAANKAKTAMEQTGVAAQKSATQVEAAATGEAAAQGRVKTEVEGTNAALMASGGAAAKGAAGVEAASMAEIGALGRVRAAASALLGPLAIGAMVGQQIGEWSWPKIQHLPGFGIGRRMWGENPDGSPITPPANGVLPPNVVPGSAGPTTVGGIPIPGLMPGAGAPRPMTDIFNMAKDTPPPNPGGPWPGQKIGPGGGPIIDTSTMPDFGGEPMPDLGGSSGGKGKKTANKRSPLPGITDPDQIVMPSGTENDPLFVDPASGFKDLAGGNNPMEQFTQASGLWGKHGVLGSVAGLMTTFLAELALGNPLGHLMGNPNSQYAWWYQGEGKGKNMFGRAEESSNKLANAFDRVNEALAHGYGPGTPQYDIAARNYRNAQIGLERTDMDVARGAGGPFGRAIEQAKASVGQAYVSGVSDCSGYISQVYSAMTGKPTHFTTTADFASLGFEPGLVPGAFNIGVTPLPGQSGHMAATLPNGVAIESGGRLGGGPKYGGGAAGADDPQFSQHWHLGGGGLGPMSGLFPGGGLAGPGLAPGMAPDFFGAGMGGSPLSPAGGKGWGRGGSAGGVGRGLTAMLNRTGGINESHQAMDTGAQKPGFGIQGLLAMAEQAGVMAAGMGGFGGGGMAAQLAEQELNRAVQTAGEAAAVMAGEFPLETFFLSGKDLSGKNVNMSTSFFGKVMGGLMGAHANIPNSAGGAEPTQTNPAMKKVDKDTGMAKDGSNNNYGVNVENIHVNNGQTMTDVHKGLNAMAMAPPGGASISRGQY